MREEAFSERRSPEQTEVDCAIAEARTQHSISEFLARTVVAAILKRRGGLTREAVGREVLRLQTALMPKGLQNIIAKVDFEKLREEPPDEPPVGSGTEGEEQDYFWNSSSDERMDCRTFFNHICCTIAESLLSQWVISYETGDSIRVGAVWRRGLADTIRTLLCNLEEKDYNRQVTIHWVGWAKPFKVSDLLKMAKDDFLELEQEILSASTRTVVLVGDVPPVCLRRLKTMLAAATSGRSAPAIRLSLPERITGERITGEIIAAQAGPNRPEETLSERP